MLKVFQRLKNRQPLLPCKSPIGRRGEDAAARLLASKGYTLLARNWRCKAGELDIIAIVNRTLVICEVKTRQHNVALKHDPLRDIAEKKVCKLHQLARIFCDLNALWLRSARLHTLRFDYVGIYMNESKLRVIHKCGSPNKLHLYLDP